MVGVLAMAEHRVPTIFDYLAARETNPDAAAATVAAGREAPEPKGVPSNVTSLSAHREQKPRQGGLGL